MAETAELLEQVRDLNEAKRFDEVVALLTDEVLLGLDSADMYAEVAEAYWRMKQKDMCKAAANKSLAIDPNNAKAFNYKGNCYWGERKYEGAIANYNRAIELMPQYALAYNGLGNVYSDLGKYNEAMKVYTRAIELDPRSVFPYCGLGNACFELNKYDYAFANYNKAVELDPEFASAYNGLGNIYFRREKYDDAIEAYNKAIGIDPKMPAPYNGLGIVYSVTKRYKEAVGAYRKAIELNPGNGSLYCNRGNILYNIGHYENAKNDYERYLELTANRQDSVTRRLILERVEQIKKLLKDDYKEIKELVDKIKDILLYTDNCVTHYTGFSTAKELIVNKSPFRLSEGAFLNDTSEGRELFDFLDFQVAPKQHRDTEAKLFAQKPFIGSFVSHQRHDDLTLWRMYGKEKKEDAKGCSITIDTRKLLESVKQLFPDDKGEIIKEIEDELKFYRVAYKTQEDAMPFCIPGSEAGALNKHMLALKMAIAEFAKDIDNKGAEAKKDVVELLNSIAFLFKGEEYQHEHELRMVVKSVAFDKKFEMKDDQAPRTYIELVDVTPLLDKITLGPKVERSEEWAAVFYYKLKQEGHEPAIYISHLPFK